MAAVDSEKKAEEEKVVSGELLFCGTTAWDTIGKVYQKNDNLVSPTRLRPLIGVDIRFVASGCASCHCVALDAEGRCYTWGRNEKGQLGHGDRIQRDRPTVVSELSKHKIVLAAAGKGHTVVLTDEGISFAFGWNKHGQLGSGSAKNGRCCTHVILEALKGTGRGKNNGKSAAAKKGTGRGRGRPPSASKTSTAGKSSTGKRGRPKKT